MFGVWRKRKRFRVAIIYCLIKVVAIGIDSTIMKPKNEMTERDKISISVTRVCRELCKQCGIFFPSLVWTSEPTERRQNARVRVANVNSQFTSANISMSANGRIHNPASCILSLDTDRWIRYWNNIKWTRDAGEYIFLVKVRRFSRNHNRFEDVFHLFAIDSSLPKFVSQNDSITNFIGQSVRHFFIDSWIFLTEQVQPCVWFGTEYGSRLEALVQFCFVEINGTIYGETCIRAFEMEAKKKKK